jgi:hypothetical protein
MEVPQLPLDRMYERHYGLSKPLAECYLEAARVCLDRHYSPPKEFGLHHNGVKLKILVEWKPTTERSKKAWANKDDATRDGAYACAIAGAELSLGLYAVRRAETLTGADYYVASNNQVPDDLEECLRLEVSGTDLDDYEVKRRLNAKVRQAEEGKSNLPAIAAVVGFRVGIILYERVE